MKNPQGDADDVDVEKLISYIKKKAQAHRAQELSSGQSNCACVRSLEPNGNGSSAPPAALEIDSEFKMQADFNQQLVRSLGSLSSYLQDLKQSLAGIEGRLHEETARSLHSTEQINDQIADLNHNLTNLKRETERTAVQTARIEHLGEELELMKQSAATNLVALRPPSLDYVLFEQRFRGSMSEIKCHQQIYLDLFKEADKIVDLGCGRGEFVELLAENGHNVTGIDMNVDMVESCRARGLNVQLADMFGYLDELPDQHLDGIFASQVIEHLSFDQLLTLIDLCGRKLKSGGIIVAETVNPNCFDALSNFYLDPSHVRPIPAKLLWFLFDQSPFQPQSVIFSSAVSPDLDETINTNFDVPREAGFYKDYALVAGIR